MTFADLNHLEEPEKREDLLKIFMAFSAALQAGNYDATSKLHDFCPSINCWRFDGELANLALVITALHASAKKSIW